MGFINLIGILRPWKKHFGKDSEYYMILDKLFGIYPNNIELYKLALIHKSASVFLNDGTAINNERLEFLGDAILEAIVSDYLFIEFPDKDEGFLTQMRSKIVSRTSLNALAIEIGLHRHIISNNNSYIQKNLYGDALEAIIGAIYLDKGYEFVNRLFINELLCKNINLDEMVSTEIDFKSRLIEWCQKSRRTIVFDTHHSHTSTAQIPCFRSKLIIDGIEAGFGEGSSKKEAEQHAACTLSYLMMSDKGSDNIMDLVDAALEQTQGNMTV